MKYYLIKKRDYEASKKNDNIIYEAITEVTAWSRSREIMLYDEIKNECWYSFLYEPDAKLKKVKKEDVKRQLSFVSNDPTLESFHEVDKDIFFGTLNNMFSTISNKDELNKIINELNDIVIKV